MIRVRKYLSLDLIRVMREKSAPGMCSCDKPDCVMCRPLIGAQA